MGGQTTFEALIKDGQAKFTGDRKPFDQLRSVLTRFTPDFELMPGTKPKSEGKQQNPPAVVKDPFEVNELADPAG